MYLTCKTPGLNGIQEEPSILRVLEDIVPTMRQILRFSAAKAKVSIRWGENKEMGRRETTVADTVVCKIKLYMQ